MSFYLETALEKKNQQQIHKRSFKQFRNCPFWIWNEQEHRRAYKETNKKCCFQHIIGLPVKNGITHPIYPWQKEIWDALWDDKRNAPNPNGKLIVINKSRGIGASELIAVRYPMWLCLKDNEMRGKNIAVITGVREDLSRELIHRFRSLLPDYNWQTGFSSSIAEINGCRVIGYPSKRVKDLRGLSDTKLVIADEFAFFDPVDQQQVLPVLEAFRTKSDAQIVLLSTPGGMGEQDVFYNLFKEPEETCRYKRLYIGYQKALGTLFSESEIAAARRMPNFEQEYNLKWGSYSANNIFSFEAIEKAIKLGKQYAARYKFYPYIDPSLQHYIGLDVGFGNSKTSITMVALWDGRAHVVISEEHYQKHEDFIIQRILYLRNKTGRPRHTPIFVDSANTSVIRRLKSYIGERQDFEQQTAELKARKLIKPPNYLELLFYSSVLSISFSKYGESMLSNLHNIIAQGNLVISPKFTNLIAQLQAARNVPNRSTPFVLDKSSSSLDSVDSLRLALFNINSGAPEFESEEEEDNDMEMITVR